jgi:hypothetical protein
MRTTIYGRVTSFLIVTAVVGLTGCASPPTREAMLVGAPATKNYPYSVSVQTRGGTETSAMTGANVSNEELKAAVESSIVASKLFKSVVQDRNGDYEITIIITQLTKPVFGASFTVEMEAGWALTKVSDKTVVLRKVIKSAHTATLDDAIVGATRMRMAIEGAARKNIAQGLQAIADLGALDADARSERGQAPAPAPGAANYPRELSGQDITAHFASHPSIEARRGEGKPGRLAPFTLRINPDRTVERSCPRCFKPSASGSIVVKQDDALVCFDWGRVPYPASGCFKVVQTSATDFQLRGVGMETVIRYSVAP